MSDIGSESKYSMDETRFHTPPPDLADPFDQHESFDPASLYPRAADEMDSAAIGVPPDRGEADGESVAPEPFPPESSRIQDQAPEPPADHSGRGPTDGPPPDVPAAAGERPDDTPSIVEIKDTLTHRVYINRGHSDRALVKALADTVGDGVPEDWIQVPDDEFIGEGVDRFIGHQGERLLRAERFDAVTLETAEVTPPSEAIELAVKAQAVVDSDDVRVFVQDRGYEGVRVSQPLVATTHHKTGVYTEYREIPEGRYAEGLRSLTEFPGAMTFEARAIDSIAAEIGTALEVNGIDSAGVSAYDLGIRPDRTLDIVPLELARLESPPPTLERGQVVQLLDGRWHSDDAARTKHYLTESVAPGSIVAMRGELPGIGDVIGARAAPGEASLNAVVLWHPDTQEGAIAHLDATASPAANVALLQAAIDRVPALGRQGALCQLYTRMVVTDESWGTTLLAQAMITALHDRNLRPKVIVHPVDRVRLDTFVGSFASSQGGESVHFYRSPRRINE